NHVLELYIMNFFTHLFTNKKPSSIRPSSQLELLEVDMHNHLLPGIDDGSASVKNSIAYIQALQKLELRKFICTPNIMAGVHPNTKSTIEEAQTALISGLKDIGNDTPIFAAAEHMIDDGLAYLVQQDE